MRVVVTGGTGFIGSKLCARLVAKGHDVIALTRDASRSRDHVHPRVRVASWTAGAAWEGFVDGAGALVNLAGETLSQRWTRSAKERIAKSRVDATARLREAVAKAGAKPEVLVNASAVGFYGPHGDDVLDESAPGVRVATLRTGLVLGEGGGALARLLPSFRAFVGGPPGTGKQWVSWIHMEDLLSLYVLALENRAVSGPLNATAPNPVTMRAFAKALGRALHRPSFMPVPAAALRLALGEMSSVVLEGQRVVPKAALGLGFTFQFSEILPALRDVVGD
jgi:NAD dependent epimerase/dehydratase family enzyme